MSSSQQRLELKKLYPGKNWSDRVDAMPDNQVAAVYIRLKNEGKL
jgi:hypothetical protein